MTRRGLIMLIVGAVLALLVIILAFSSILADPRSGSGEGDIIRPPTTTTR